MAESRDRLRVEDPMSAHGGSVPFPSYGPGVPRRPIVGRDAEMARLDELLVRATSNQSGSLLLVGEAGAGKTHLLEHFVARAEPFRVLRVAGAESETRMVFAGLDRMISPLLDRMGSLPIPQHRAMATALGLSDEPFQRLHLGLAVLAVLRSEAAVGPLLIVVDDAHWLDPDSLEVLAFVARRLESDAIAMVLSSRIGQVPQPVSDMATLELGGLTARAVGELLASLDAPSFDPLTVDIAHLVKATNGNPLAVVELAHAADASRLRASLHLQGELSVGDVLVDHFRRQVAGFSPRCQQLLLLAAANGRGDSEVLWVAADLLGLGPEDADAAVGTGVWSYEPDPAFRHPLIRTAVYSSADPGELRRVHAALAKATDSALDAEGYAWHRACATALHDEEVASLLEACAVRVRPKGGYATQATYLTRAAELSRDPVLKAERQLGAGQALLRAGDRAGAQRILDQVASGVDNPHLRVQVTRLQAVIHLAGAASASEISAHLVAVLDEARLLESGLARTVTLEALGAAFLSGRHMTGLSFGELNAAVASLEDEPSLSPADQSRDLLAMAGAFRMYAGHARAAAKMKHAVADIVHDEVSMDGEIGLTTLAVLMPAELWDLGAMKVLASRYRAHDLDQGSMGSLRSSQAALARVHLLEGDFSSAQLLMSELRGLVAMLSPEPSVVDTPYEAELFVWIGDEYKAREIIDTLIHRWGVQLGKSVLEDWGWMSLAVLENSLGNYQQALEAAVQAVDHDHLPWSSQALPEAIEAAARTHNEAEALLRLEQLRERVAASPTPWSEGLLARSEGICAHGAEADTHFRTAIALLAASGVRTEHARSHLLYGEWLRREGRKLDARVQLKQALGLFNALGAQLFAHRCEVELRATGERITRAAGDPRTLTSQEQQVAELAASGLTNKEISTKLFIGESTVEFHMTKILRKLEIRSRRQLKAMLPQA